MSQLSSSVSLYHSITNSFFFSIGLSQQFIFISTAPVPAPRVRNPPPSTSSQGSAAGFTIPSIPLSKINHSLDTAKFNSELKSLSREFKNYKNESHTRPGKSPQSTIQLSRCSQPTKSEAGEYKEPVLPIIMFNLFGMTYCQLVQACSKRPNFFLW